MNVIQINHEYSTWDTVFLGEDLEELKDKVRQYIWDHMLGQEEATEQEIPDVLDPPGNYWYLVKITTDVAVLS